MRQLAMKHEIWQGEGVEYFIYIVFRQLTVKASSNKNIWLNFDRQTKKW